MRPGEAPSNADRIFITRRPDGTASWTGAVGAGSGAPVFGNSVSDLRSVADAEARAIEWAHSKRVSEIVIESDET